jgi:hypothetical protein
MPDQLAMIRLPDPEEAPGYRASLSSMSHFNVADMGAGIVGVAPAEGAAGTAKHFEVHKLCDAGTDLLDPATWTALREHPPRKGTTEEPTAFRDRMVELGEQIRQRRGGSEGELVAFNLVAMGAAQTGELPDLLTAQLPTLFEQFPSGSLWLASVSDVLLARLSFGRAQFALKLTPDLPLGPEMERLKAVTGLGLGAGADFMSVMRLPLLALSPAVLGLTVPAMPHVLVFLFGEGVELRRMVPISLAAMYRPNALDDPRGLGNPSFLDGLESSDGEELLTWWVARLNAIYSHASDPTRFTEPTVAVRIYNAGRGSTSIVDILLSVGGRSGVTDAKLDPPLPFRLEGESEKTWHFDARLVQGVAQVWSEAAADSSWDTVHAEVRIGGSRKVVRSENTVPVEALNGSG